VLRAWHHPLLEHVPPRVGRRRRRAEWRRRRLLRPWAPRRRRHRARRCTAIARVVPLLTAFFAASRLALELRARLLVRPARTAATRAVGAQAAHVRPARRAAAGARPGHSLNSCAHRRRERGEERPRARVSASRVGHDAHSSTDVP
jgi:hypothetical protein